MEATTTIISYVELKRLLLSMFKVESPVCIRYRTIGELWYPNFLRIVKLEEGMPILFHDSIRNKFITLPDLSRIIQFEIDQNFYPLEPNCHYHLTDDESANDH